MNYNDLEGKLVADLGCGCGMLSIGAALLGAQLTIGFEIDSDAIKVSNCISRNVSRSFFFTIDFYVYKKVLTNNIQEIDITSIDCIHCDVLYMPIDRWRNTFNTIVMNPPFGTKKNNGIHLDFLEKAITMSNGVVYSLHKSSTKAHIGRIINNWNVKGEVLAKLNYNIDSSFRFHKYKSVDIEVDLWRFDASESTI